MIHKAGSLALYAVGVVIAFALARLGWALGEFLLRRLF